MSSVGDMVQRLEAAASTMAAGKAAGARDDRLASLLVAVAQHYGQSASAVALTAGLPLVGGRLPLEHAEAAARRAGLTSRIAERRPSSLTDVELPCIVLREGKSPVVAWAVERDGAGKVVALTLSGADGDGARITRALDEFEAETTGQVLLLRPNGSTDQRGQEAAPAAKARWFLPAFRASRRIYAEAILATIAINVLALAMPLFTMNVYDRVLPNAVEETLWALAIGAALATIFDFAIKSLRASFVDAASRRADVVLANYIFGRILGARLAEKPVSAGVRANALREFETLREFFNSATLTAFGDLPFLVLFLLMIWVVAGDLVLIPLAAVPLVLAIGWITQRMLARLSEASFKETAQKNAVAVETLVGLESVKAAGAESWAAAKWETAVAEHVRTSVAIRNLSNLGTHTVHGAQTLTQILMIIAGFYKVAAGDLTTGGLIAATMLAGRTMQPLGAVANLIARLHQTRIAYRTLNDIVETPQERPDGAQLLAKTRFEGSVTFERVTFAYDRETAPALLDVSFEIKPGERVGIVGAIGSGKTTILKLIQALHQPSQGRVLVDGLPVAQIDPALLRKGVGLSLQGAELFHGTIRTNIALADPGAPDDEILWAARAAGALDWIARCPKGLDTPVRERGSGLSGGQGQSVTLARALFRQPRVILLDEPTSNMDARSEMIAVEGLKEASRSRTLIAVSHRPALLGLVDRLIVLEGGRKLLDGPKQAVLQELEALTAQRTRVGTKPAEAKA